MRIVCYVHTALIEAIVQTIQFHSVERAGRSQNGTEHCGVCAEEGANGTGKGRKSGVQTRYYTEESILEALMIHSSAKGD